MVRSGIILALLMAGCQSSGLQPRDPTGPTSWVPGTDDGDDLLETPYVGGDTGGEVEAPGSLDGDDDPDIVIPEPDNDLYILSFAAAEFPQLPEASGLLHATPDDLVLEVMTVDPPTLFVRLGGAHAGVSPPRQDLCVATSDLDEGQYDGDQFRVRGAPPDLHHPFDWYELDITGALALDEDEQIRAVAIRAEIDVQHLAQVIGWSPAETCDQLALRGLACRQCGQRGCVKLRITNIDVSWAPAMSLEPLEQGDVDENPGC